MHAITHFPNNSGKTNFSEPFVAKGGFSAAGAAEALGLPCIILMPQLCLFHHSLWQQQLRGQILLSLCRVLLSPCLACYVSLAQCFEARLSRSDTSPGRLWVLCEAHLAVAGMVQLCKSVCCRCWALLWLLHRQCLEPGVRDAAVAAAVEGLQRSGPSAPQQLMACDCRCGFLKVLWQAHLAVCSTSSEYRLFLETRPGIGFAFRGL